MRNAKSLGAWVLALLVVGTASADKRTMLELTQEAINLPSNEQSKKIDLYTRAIGEYKGFYLPWTNRAVCYLNYGRWDEAIADATEAINLAPEDPHAWGVRGRAHAGKRKYDQAFRDLGRALELARTSEEKRNLFNDRGNANLSARKYEAAITDYQKSLQIDPEFAQGYNNLGIAYRAIGDLDRAIVALDTAIRLDGVSPRALVNRARVYTARHDAVMAQTDLDRAAALDEKDPSTFLNRGMFFYLEGEKDRAVQDFDTALRLDAANPYTAIWHYLGVSSVGDKDQAKGDLTKFISAQKETAWPMPLVKFLAGEASEEDVLKEARAGDDSVRIRERLAEAYFYLAQNAILVGDEAKGREFLTQSAAQSIPRSQEYVMAKVQLEGERSPTPPPPRVVPTE